MIEILGFKIPVVEKVIYLKNKDVFSDYLKALKDGKGSAKKYLKIFH